MQSATKNESLTRTAANDVEDVTGDLRNAAGRAGRKVRHLIDSASSELSHAGETVTTRIKSHPLQSSLIAMGVGVVLGALLRR